MNSSLRFLARALTRRASIALLLLAGLLIALDFFTSFWNDHQMLTSIVSSALFVGIALSVIETWTDEREAARWKRVANISYKALARSAVVTRDGLIVFLEGKLPYPEDPTPQAEDCDRASELLRVHEGLDDCDRLARLDELLQDPKWVAYAYGGVRILAAQSREVLAGWAPVMVQNPTLAKALDHVAALTDALEDLHRPLGPIHRTGQGIQDHDRREATAQLWDDIITGGVVAEEGLWYSTGRRVGRDIWTSRARELLSERGCDRISLGTPDRVWRKTNESLSELRDRVRELHPPSRETAIERRLARDQRFGEA